MRFSNSVLWVVTTNFFSILSLASNYPPSYTYQTVQVIQQGPGVFAHIGSGILSNEVIGYKQSGPLASQNPQKIDAVLMIHCKDNAGYSYSKQSVVKLNREWNGNGYLSDALSIYDLQDSRCEVQASIAFEVAFSDGNNHWDSKGGLNYQYTQAEFWSGGAGVASYTTNRPGDTTLDPLVWNFLRHSLKNDIN